jgi:hypothetical protein
MAIPGGMTVVNPVFKAHLILDSSCLPRNFGNIYSEGIKNLLQDLTSASVSQAGARFWTIEYQASTQG